MVAMVTFKPVDPMLAARSHQPYMARIDRICEKRVRQEKALGTTGELNLISERVLLRQEERKIEKLPKPPAEVRSDVGEVIAHHRRINGALARMMDDVHRSPGDPNVVVDQHRPAIDGLLDGAHRRFMELGLPYCAS
jgi:hypothetical protein